MGFAAGYLTDRSAYAIKQSAGFGQKRQAGQGPVQFIIQAMLFKQIGNPRLEALDRGFGGKAEVDLAT